MSERIDENQLRAKLFRGKTQAELARELGVSRAYACDLFHGRRPISNKILEKLGYERVIMRKEYFRKAKP